MFNILKIQVSVFFLNKSKGLAGLHSHSHPCPSARAEQKFPSWRWQVVSSPQTFALLLEASHPWGHVSGDALPGITFPCWYVALVSPGLHESTLRSF